MSKPNWMISLPLAVLAGTGCYGAKTLQQPVTVDRIDRNVQSVMEQQAGLDASLHSLQQTVAEQQEMIRALRAETQTRLQEISESIQALNNQVGDSFQRRPIFARPPEEGMNAPGIAPIGEGQDSSGAAAAAGALTPAQAKAIYDNAYLDLSRGNYSLALIGFRDYLTKGQDSDLADNAQYWIGECYYAQRDFRKALEEFSKVEQLYPRGDKVPAALLKIAYCRIQLEDRAGARDALRDLITRFPNSEEAGQARSKLKSLE